MTLHVVSLGDVMSDVVCLLPGPLAPGTDTPASVRTEGGGAGANTAAWLVAAGVRATYVGRVGADLAGTWAQQLLREAGVALRVTVDPDRPTGTCVVLVGADGERTMVPDSGANAHWAREDVAGDLWGPDTHLHVSGYALLNPGARDAARYAMAAAREAGSTTSVDPASVGPLVTAGVDDFLAWVADVDVLLPNAAEAALLTGSKDPRKAAAQLAEHIGTVVVTCGADGAVAAAAEGAAAVGGLSVDAIDTTGAGDAFAAGFLASWLRGDDLESALVAGNRFGARAVAQLGARP